MSRYSANKIGKLIQDYIEDKSSTAELEISNMIIDGENLADGLKYLRSHYLKIQKENEDELVTKENLISDLEEILGTKEGEFPDKIREIIKIYLVKEKSK